MQLVARRLAVKGFSNSKLKHDQNPSCPGLSRAPTPYYRSKKVVDGRDKPGYDEKMGSGLG